MSRNQSQAAVLAVDQGTSSTKAVLVGENGAVLGKSSIPISRRDPRPGWVEQSATQVRDSVIEALSTIMNDTAASIVGVGISNQRESALIWSRDSGGPLGPMLGWQDRRTADRATVLARRGLAESVRSKTGLPLDAAFSALKFQWLLDQIDPNRTLARAGRIAVGTVDCWIVHCLTGEHRIEIGNASRTQLLNLESTDWDDDLLDLFNIPRQCLPRIADSNEPSLPIREVPLLDGVRIHGVLGDSHAALFAHGARTSGQVKATYGSGGSVMGLTETLAAETPSSGLVQTIAWGLGEPKFAFEGTALSLGATLVWLSEMLGVELSQLSNQARQGAEGIDVVPAFTGLGAPYWDEQATALIAGLGLGTSAADVARGAFESVVLQIEALLRAAESDLKLSIDTLLADGGPTSNDWLMQTQADLSQRSVLRSNLAELSALGSAYLAGLSCDFWGESECLELPRDQSAFRPDIPPEIASSRWSRWEAAVQRSMFRPATSDNEA